MRTRLGLLGFGGTLASAILGCGNPEILAANGADASMGDGSNGRPPIFEEGGSVRSGCVPRSCADLKINCGPAGDGCGGVVECGTCKAPETCGGGGQPSVCGGNSGCIPKTCAGIGATCGPAADGCGGLLTCGTCTAPDICGGGGKASVCGGGDRPACTPKSCRDLGANCGPIADGCGGLIASCGMCKAPESCGAGGLPNVCGTNVLPDGGLRDGGVLCVPRQCKDLGSECGPAGDGCGGSIQCGSCPLPQTCGGGGKPSVCGGTAACVPKTCADQNISCGPAGDGCGNLIQCGSCTAPETCGGGGVPGKCGGNNGCIAMDCTRANANCGPAADGCGGLIQCGACTPPAICGGGGVPSMCGAGLDAGVDGGPPCENLCKQQVACSGGLTTILSGTVLAPTPAQFGTPDPLYNALIYVPNSPVEPFKPGVTCDQCSGVVSGSPLVRAYSGPDGKFTLQNVPVGKNIPLVIQLGRWRRQVIIPEVQPCVENTVPAELSRLPRNKKEGDIPLIAVATGAVDTLECVLRKIGIDDLEFTLPSRDGRVHIFYQNGADIGSGTPPGRELYADVNVLKQYDMVLFPCEGRQKDKVRQYQDNIINYTNAGGRVFATHYSYVWLYNVPPFQGTGTWVPDPGVLHPPPNPLTGTIDTSFPKGQAFSQWLKGLGVLASQSPPTIKIHVPRHDLDAPLKDSQRWIYSEDPATIQHYAFNTPVAAPGDQQCGRVIFSDFHVNNVESSASQGATYPDECTGGPMTPQEKVLEFMLFDLAACIEPDKPPPPPTCTPRNCDQAGAKCGPVGDGCGGVIQCGDCASPATCGGGGVPSACGETKCPARNCAYYGFSCGQIGDGCGASLNCGDCPPGQTCGGGGVHGTCGAPSCKPATCASLGFNCGPAADGCGGLIICGECEDGKICGAEKPGVCGVPDGGSCIRLTCSKLGFDCGPAGDGCGGTLACGECPPGQTCGGGGVFGRCGAPSCKPISCDDQKLKCGPAGDGCGGKLDCGPCPTGQTCGGAGKPGECGAPACKPKTCADLKADCGPAADGCGGILTCGSCTPPDTCGGGGIPNVCGSIR